MGELEPRTETDTSFEMNGIPLDEPAGFVDASTRFLDDATLNVEGLLAELLGEAFAAAWLLGALRRKRIVPVIPSRSDQPENPDFDREAYRERNLAERLIGKLKQFRRVATRCDKLAIHYLAFVQLASVMVWLCSFGDAP
jgi:hypothetical protein